MGRVSKKELRPELKGELDEQMSTLIELLSNKEEIHQFLDDFLTEEERTMLGKRLVLYMMIRKGYISIDIQSSLAISFETIRSHKYFLESKSDIFKEKIQKLLSIEKNKHLWKKLERILTPIELALSAKTNMKARAKFLSGDVGD